MYNFIHLSDIHFAPGAFEQRPAFRPFLDDLGRQITKLIGDTYLILSGDIANWGAVNEHYTSFLAEMDNRLHDIGIPRARRICVPGNHDASRNIIEQRFLEHEAIVSKEIDESDLNEFLQQPSPIFTEKFKNYLKFEQDFASCGVGPAGLGAGHS